MVANGPVNMNHHSACARLYVIITTGFRYVIQSAFVIVGSCSVFFLLGFDIAANKNCHGIIEIDSYDSSKKC